MSHRFQRKIRHRENEDPLINLTPLIDVVFSILIMFIVIAPLLELDRILLADGASEGLEEKVSVKEQGAIAIQVDEHNTIWVNRQAVGPSQLVPVLKAEKQKHPTARPQIYHDRRAQFGTYQTLKNSLESAGFEEMDLILKPQ